MDNKREQDEYLERLWHMKEEGTESFQHLKSAMGEGFDSHIVDELVSERFDGSQRGQ